MTKNKSQQMNEVTIDCRSQHSISMSIYLKCDKFFATALCRGGAKPKKLKNWTSR